MSSLTQPLHRSNFIAEARQLIVGANNGHFQSLAILFFFPLWFFLISFPLFLQSNSGITPKSLLSFYTTYPINFKSIAFSSLYTLFLFSLSIVGIATVTYSTHHGFYRRPLTLITTIKSLSSSFFPLASTICLVVICITAPFASILYAIKIIIGFEIDSNYFCIFAALIIILGLFLLFCQVYCLLAGVIAVVESKWGFEPLRQSYYLIKRMKLTCLSLLLLYGFVFWCVVLGFWSVFLYFGGIEWSYMDLLQVASISFFEALLTVQFVAASTVLYLYNGEWVLAIADKNYSSFAIDDELKLAPDS